MCLIQPVLERHANAAIPGRKNLMCGVCPVAAVLCSPPHTSTLQLFILVATEMVWFACVTICGMTGSGGITCVAIRFNVALACSMIVSSTSTGEIGLGGIPSSTAFAFR